MERRRHQQPDTMNTSTNDKNKSEDRPRTKCTKKCRKCGEIGHVEKYCLTTDGGCLYIGDLPPSFTDEEVRSLVEEHGGLVVNVRTGLDKFGSRWALLNMETKESGAKVLRSIS